MRRSNLVMLFASIIMFIAVHVGAISLEPGQAYPDDVSQDMVKSADFEMKDFSITFAGSTLWQGTNVGCGDGTYGYCYPYFGFQVIDFSNPAGPAVIGEYYHPAQAYDMVVVDNFVYVAASSDGLMIFDVSDPYQPVLASTTWLDIPSYSSAHGVEIAGSTAYVSASRYFLIIDISNPYAPELINYLVPVGLAFDAAINGDYAYIASEFFLEIWDLSDPLAPVYKTKEYCGETDVDVYDVVMTDPYLFVANRNEGLFALTSNDAWVATIGSWKDTTSTYAEIEAVGDYAYLCSYNAIQIIDVHDPYHPARLGDWSTGGSNTSVYLSGDLAYVSDWTAGLYRYDISTPTAPALESQYENPGMGYALAVSGNYAFEANGIKGMQVLDISNPERPTVIASHETPGQATTIVAVGDYVYVGDEAEGITVFDVSDPFTPVLQTTLVLPDDARDVIVNGSYLYAAVENAGLYIIDISDPAVPVIATSLDTYVSLYRLVMQGSYLYISDWDAGVHILDIGDPGSPSYVGVYPLDGYCFALAVSGNYVYISHGYQDQMDVVDVSDPLAPVKVGEYVGLDLTRHMEILGDYLYIADYTKYFKILDISDPMSPTLAGGYITSPGWAWDVDILGNNIYVTCDNGLLSLWQDGCAGPNGDGAYDVADAVFLIAYVFLGGAAPEPLRVGDVNGDGDVNLGDAVALIDFIFKGGSAPAGGCY